MKMKRKNWETMAKQAYIASGVIQTYLDNGDWEDPESTTEERYWFAQAVLDAVIYLRRAANRNLSMARKLGDFACRLEDDSKSRDERVITAANLDDAIAQAEDYAWDWVHDGEWGDADVDVPVYYRIYDESTGAHLHRGWISIHVNARGGDHE